MTGGLALRTKNILVLDAGLYAFHVLYQELLRSRRPLRVSIGYLTDTQDTGRIRIDNMADRFGVEAQHIDDIITTKGDTHNFDCIILMAPRGKKRKEILIKLMKELSPCPPILVGTASIDSLAEAIELLAYAKRYNTTICVETLHRYTAGVRAIRDRLPDLAPLSHIVASVNSGAHLSMHEYMYGTVVAYADLICFLAGEATEIEEIDQIPKSLFCHHSDLYGDSVSASFAFNSGLIGNLASTSNHHLLIIQTIIY